MIKVVFFKNKSYYYGFKVSGHANYGNLGSDIVCAGVSSAVMMTVNTITEVQKIPAEVTTEADLVSIKTSSAENSNNELQTVYKGLYLHMTLLEEDYKENINVSIMEV